MKRYIIWGLVALVVIGLGLYFVMHKPESAPTTSTSGPTETTDRTDTLPNRDASPAPAPSPNPPAPAPAPTPAPTAPSPNPITSASTVVINASGFSPQHISVKAGTTVTFVNNDTQQHWPASDPHPQHNAYPGFDAKRGLNQGESYSFTFTKVDTWTFHDHLNPTVRGTISVNP